MTINFNALTIGRRALNASQYGINVTGQNIANVNTPGYSRQRVVLSESAPASLHRNAVGTGVTVESVQAFRDRFIESRLQTETGVSGRLSARRDWITPLETSLQGPPNGGINYALSQFFNSFRDLEANPNSTPLRGLVVQNGANLASNFQTTRGRLEALRRDADASLRTTVDEANSLARQIAGLNSQVAQAEAVGANSASLRDQRSEMVRQFSELTGAWSIENQDGTLTLTAGDGRALVMGPEAKELVAQTAPPLGLATITLDGETAVLNEGKLRGLTDAVGMIGEQMDALDGLAAQVAARVNALHTSGTDQAGNPGVNFFAVPAGGAPVTAANLAVNPAVAADSRLVVASPLSQPGRAGTVAGAIADLLTDQTTTVGSRTGSFASIFGGMVAEAGDNVRSDESALDMQGAVLAQINAQRDAVSGVSLDEEAINLMQYQKSFEAAARFLKVADEMTQTILSLAQ